MPREHHEITRDDLMDMKAYEAIRKQRRTEISAVKRHRRVEVGPFATFYFESFETMWHQIHEMLFIEKGGEAQIADELSAYNPLIPKGRELVATVMIEIDDPTRRANALARMGGIEDAMAITIAGEEIKAIPEADIDRTTADGKASSVQFVHFPFTDDQIAKFKSPGTQVIVGINHPNYAHMAVMPEAVREALAGDFD